MSVLTDKDRADIEREIEEMRGRLWYVENADPDLIRNVKVWYRDIRRLEDHIRDLEAQL